MCEFVLVLCILLTNKGTIKKKFVSGRFMATQCFHSNVMNRQQLQP